MGPCLLGQVVGALRGGEGLGRAGEAIIVAAVAHEQGEAR